MAVVGGIQIIMNLFKKMDTAFDKFDDTVRRYFEYKGYDVNFVSNFTDVDDKIIKKAIEEIFKVKVVDVNTVRINGKMKRMGRYEGKTSDYKKAIVQLAEGDSIEIFEGL